MHAQDLTGQQIGPYKLDGLIGMGGMAAVYASYQASVQRRVAVKVLPSHLAEQSGYLERFKREVELAARLEHPHILPVYDHGTDKGLSYIVMRLLQGGSLSQHLRENQALEISETLKILNQVGGALDYAHHENVVHRDLKPSNVLFDHVGNAYLSDFGISKVITDSTSGLTGTGQIIGTPTYMAPEQWEGADATPKTDLYALGILAYMMLTGRLPFEAPTPLALMRKHLYDTPQSPLELRPDLPLAVEAVIAKSLAKRPENRFNSAKDFINTLERALRGEIKDFEATSLKPQTQTYIEKGTTQLPNELTLTPGTPTLPPVAQPTRGKGIWVMAALVVLIALVVGGYFALFNGNDNDADDNPVLALMNEGDSAFSEGRLPDAIVAYNDALTREPSNAALYARRARVFVEQGNIENAVADYQRAISLQPNNPEHYRALADMYYNRGEYEEAFWLYQQAEQLGAPVRDRLSELEAWRATQNAPTHTPTPTDTPTLTPTVTPTDTASPTVTPSPTDTPEPTHTPTPRVSANEFYRQGRVYYDQANYIAAIEAFTQAIEIDPTLGMAYIDRGNAYYALNNDSAALADYTTAIELGTTDPAPYYNRGLIYRQNRDYEKAIADYSKAVEIDPTYGKAYYWLGVSYSRIEDYQAAIESYNEAIGLGYDLVNSYYQRGAAYYELHDLEAALADFQQTIAINPNDADAYLWIGEIHYQLQQYRLAQENFQRHVDLADIPDDLAVNRLQEIAALPVLTADDYFNMAVEAYNAGNYEEAIEIYTQAIALDSTDPAFYNNRGTCYFNLGQYTQALEDYNAALVVDDTYVLAHYNRGNTNFVLGNYADSITDLTRAIELDPRKSEAYYVRGLSYASLDLYDEALLDYNKALELGYGVPERVYNARGYLYYYGKNNETAAIRDFQNAITVNPNYMYPYFNLGDIYYTRGDYALSLENYQTYVRLAGRQADALAPQRIEEMTNQLTPAPALVWQQQLEIGGGIGDVRMVAAGADNTVYISDGIKIYILNDEGAIQRTIEPETVLIFKSMAVASDGSFWLAGAAPAYLTHMAADGRILATYGGSDAPRLEQLGIAGPETVQVGVDGIYTFYTDGDDSYVAVHSFQGLFLRRFQVNPDTGGAFRSFGAFTQLMITSNGSLLLLDSGGRIKLLDRQGNLLREDYPVLRPNVISAVLNRAFLTRDGRLYLPARNGIIYKFNADMTLAGQYGTRQSDKTAAFKPGEFYEPVAVVVLSDGGLIVIDKNEVYNQIVRLNFP